jgi:hypothetical protein
MMPTIAVKSSLILIIMLLGVATALPARAGAPGTFLVAEGQAGYAFGGAFAEAPGGVGLRVAVGAGGRVGASGLRLYGVASVTFAELSGAVSGLAQSATTSRSWTAWTLGLRALHPIFGRLRVLGEISLGQALVESRAVLNRGAEVYADRDDALLVDVAVGLQYRVGLHLSLGTRCDLAVPTNLEAFDVIGAFAGAGAQGGAFNVSTLGTLTVHL